MKPFRSSARALLACCLAAATVVTAPLALAAPPAQQQTQVPGYYRFKLGSYEVTALYDGYVDLEPTLVKGLKSADLQSLLARMFVATTPGVQTAVNGFLVHTGSQLILVDTGTAQCFGPTLGRIGANLRASGYEAAQVDAVLLTHLHPDHACGLVGDGKPNFPNATVYVAEAEAAFWTSEAALKALAGREVFVNAARASIEPYRQAGRLKTFKPGETLLGAVASEDTGGHTPGHVSYRFTAPEGGTLFVIGDLIHSHAVQFARPDQSVEFDLDGKAAIASRRKAFDEAAAGRLWVAGAHLPFPGLGHIRRDGKAYAWVPVEYGPWRSDR